jgi:hypothetical protein
MWCHHIPWEPNQVTQAFSKAGNEIRQKKDKVLLERTFEIVIMKSAHLSKCDRILPKEDSHVTCVTWYLDTSIESGTWFSSDSVQPRNHTVNTRLADA